MLKLFRLYTLNEEINKKFKRLFLFKKYIDLKKRLFLRCVVLANSSRQNLTNSSFCCNITMRLYINFEMFFSKIFSSFVKMTEITRNTSNITSRFSIFFINYEIDLKVSFFKFFKNSVSNETVMLIEI